MSQRQGAKKKSPNYYYYFVVVAFSVQKTQAEWRNVFYVCGGFTLFGAIVFGGFARTDTEPWARDPDDDLVDDVRKAEIDVDVQGRGNGKIAYDNEGMDSGDAVYNDVTDTRL